MNNDKNLVNIYYKLYICQILSGIPYSDYVKKMKEDLITLSSKCIDNNTPSKENTANKIVKENENNLNEIAQTIGLNDNIDFEKDMDEKYYKSIIYFKNRFYSKVNVVGMIKEYVLRTSDDGKNSRIELKIDDGTGRIKIIFWENKNQDNNKFEEIKDKISIGIKINILGKISIFKNEIQIVADNFFIINDYRIENLFDELLMEEQKALNEINKEENKINFINCQNDNIDIIKTLKETYYSPYNFELNYQSNNSNKNITEPLFLLKHKTDNILEINEKEKDYNFHYNIKKFANYLMLVLDEKDLIESSDIKYISEEDANNDINNNKMDIEIEQNNNNNKDVNENDDFQLNEEEMNELVRDEFMDEEEKIENYFSIRKPQRNAKYLQIKIKNLLNDNRIIGLLTHFIPYFDIHNIKSIKIIFNYLIDLFDQNLIGRKLTENINDNNYLETKLEFDVKFFDKVRNQIVSFVQKKAGSNVTFFEIKKHIEMKYDNLFLDRIIRILLQTALNNGDKIKTVDKNIYTYIEY